MTEADLNERLLPGERMLWTGRPGQGLRLRPQDIVLVPFSLVWCGFAVFWTWMAMRGSAPPFFIAWGLMFVAVGLYFVFGRLLADAWIRSGMVYGLTDKRALMMRPAPFASFTAVFLADAADLRLNEAGGGRGTILFGPAAPAVGGRGGMSGWSPALDATPQFIAIEDARSVFDLAQRARLR